MTASYNLSQLGSNYLQGGTGSVARTTASKLQESVSVKDFGAVGDGTTDDTAAIQAAINSIPLLVNSTDNGYELYFPTGKYKITSTLTVGYRRITFWAPSVMGSGAAAQIYMATSNTLFIDFTTGNADTIAFHGLMFIGTGTGTGNCLNLGRTAQPCYDSRITNCWFSAIGGTAIVGTNLQGCHITNNAFDASNAVGINLVVGLDNIISHNRFYGQTTNGIQLAKGSNNLIANNIMDFCGSSNDTTAAILFNYASTDTRGNSIVGNLFRANQNDIVLNGNGGVYASNTGVNDTAIVGNTSDRAYRHFLYATDSHQIRCVSNVICDPNSAAASLNGIDILGTCDSAYFSGNSISIGTATPVYGLNLGSSTTNTIVGGNHFAGSSTAINVTAGATLAYENEQKGTWTPTVGGTATYTIQEGYYTKISDLVYVQCKLVINVLGTGSAGVISGLPFPVFNAASAEAGSGTVSYFSSLATSVVSLVACAVNNTSNVQFNGLTAAATTMSANIGILGNGTRVDFSLVYKTTA